MVIAQAMVDKRGLKAGPPDTAFVLKVGTVSAVSAVCIAVVHTASHFQCWQRD